MKRLNCLIIEDEPIAAKIVQSYIEQVGFLTLDSICTNAISAIETLNIKKIDLIFLDIHLPKLKGIDFLKSLSKSPRVIITSAYDQYAIEGFELEIVDYLLKPFSFPRFLKAVNKLKNNEPESLLNIPLREFRFFNVNKKMVKIYLDEILYIESLKEYVKVYTKEKTIITKFQIGELEKFLNNNNFLRIHRSYVVSKSKIESFSFEELEINGKLLPIGRSFSDSVKQELLK